MRSDGGGCVPVSLMSLAGGVNVCASVFRNGVRTSCGVDSLAIRHGTSCYSRGTMLPGWILNGGLWAPVDALEPGSVRGGQLSASRKRWCGARTASTGEVSPGARFCGPASLLLFLLALSVGPVFLVFCCCLVFCLAVSSVVSSWCLCPRRPPSASPAGGRAVVTGAAAPPVSLVLASLTTEP